MIILDKRLTFIYYSNGLFQQLHKIKLQDIFKKKEWNANTIEKNVAKENKFYGTEWRFS